MLRSEPAEAHFFVGEGFTPSRRELPYLCVLCAARRNQQRQLEELKRDQKQRHVNEEKMLKKKYTQKIQMARDKVLNENAALID